MLALTGVSIILLSQEIGWANAIMQNIAYLFYIVVVIGTWTTVGEMLANRVSGMWASEESF